MAIVKAVNSRASLKSIFNYVTKKEKTEEKLLDGINCSPSTAFEEMMLTKELYDKTDGRTYKHFVLSYPPGENIDLEKIRDNAKELVNSCDSLNGHQVFIAVHDDREHKHAHIIVNSVSLEDGHKLQWSKKDLARMKERCNELSREQGLHVPEKGKTYSGEEREETAAWSKETYNLLKRAEKGEVKSYIQEIALAVMECKEQAKSREDFIQKMNEKGYGVDWQDTRKYITFTDLERQNQGEKKCKVRNNKLETYFAVDFGKESLEHGFEVNLRREKTIEQANAQLRRVGADQEADKHDYKSAVSAIGKEQRARDDKRRAIEAQRREQELARARRESEARARQAERTKPKPKSSPYDHDR